MRQRHNRGIEELREQVMAGGVDELGSVFGRLLNMAMRMEREKYLNAGYYERTPDRRGYANGFKSKTIDTAGGTISVEIPKTRGHEEGAPFFPQSLERGRRSTRAVLLAVSEI